MRGIYGNDMNHKGAGGEGKNGQEVTVDNANCRCGLLGSAMWEEKHNRALLHARERGLQRGHKLQGVKVRTNEK